MFLCHEIRQLRQCFGRSDADTDRYADFTPDGFPNGKRLFEDIRLPGHIQKRLVHTVFLMYRRKNRQQPLDTVTQIGIQREIAGKYDDFTIFRYTADLEPGYPHTDTKCLGFIAARNDTTIIA